MIRTSFVSALLFTTSLGLGIAHAGDAPKSPVPALLEELAKYQDAEKTVAKHIETFDTLDFDVYTHRKWDRLGESHAADILVHYPDGHTTKGLHDHVEELKPMFVFAPGECTAEKIDEMARQAEAARSDVIIGVGGGKTIAPTGKPFKLTMSTIGHWTKAGVMDEEYLFWDNQAFMKQIGLAP